jgi:hypothetical protein
LSSSRQLHFHVVTATVLLIATPTDPWYHLLSYI